MNTMYFSVITPEDGLLRQAAHEFSLAPVAANKATSYAEHQWIWQFFPSGEDQSRDFIFRRHDLGGTPRFYVVSRRPPVEFGSAWVVRTSALRAEFVSRTKTSLSIVRESRR